MEGEHLRPMVPDCQLLPVQIFFLPDFACSEFFSPHRRRREMWTLVGTSEDGRIHILDGETGSTRFNVLGHSKSCGSVAMSPDGSRIATASEDSSWKMWDAASGRELLVVAGHDGQGACTCVVDAEGMRAEVRASCPRVGHGGGVIDVAFSPCGQRIATAGGENVVTLWSAFTGEEDLRLAMPWLNHVKTISVAFSPDASQIATGSEDERICVWDARNGELLCTILNAHAGGVESICFSPDGFHLASVGRDGAGKVWDARSGAQVRSLENRRGDGGSCVKYAPNGRSIAAGSTAGSVTVWDAASGEEALCLAAHTGRAPSIATLPVQGYLAHKQLPTPLGPP